MRGVLGVLIPRRDFTRVDRVGLATAEGLAVGPEVGIGAEGEDFGRVDGAFGVVGTGRAGLKWVSGSTAATSMGASGAVKNEFPGEDWTGNGKSFVARESVRVVIIGTGVDLIVAIIFIEDQPGIDISDVASDIDFLGEDEDLWKIIYSIVGFVGDINIAIDSESTVHVHGEGIHKLFTSVITSCDKVAATIELIEISGTIHGTKAGIPLVVKLREAEIVLRRSLIRGETGDSIRRIPDDSVAETGLETGEDSGADARDARFARFIIVRNCERT